MTEHGASLRIERRTEWTVTFNRPARANAFSDEVVESLIGVLDAASTERPAALVFRGNGRHFASGFDLAGLDTESDGSLALRFLRIGLLLERIAAAPYLTVAVVEGAAVGAGADLAAACDHRLVGPEAVFRFPGPQFGIVLGTARLARMSGPTAIAAGRTVDPAAISTGKPDDLDEILRGWSATHPSARPDLLAAARASPNADAALAALARSVAEPGLRTRLAGYAGRNPAKEIA